jgi:signal peptidase I
MKKDTLTVKVMGRSVTRDADNVSPFIFILIAVVIFLIVKLFIVDVLRVNGHSMEPTFNPGQLILVDRCAYGLLLPFSDTYLLTWSGPKTGDVIVIRNPMDNGKIIKRCIAVSGERVKIEDGVLFIEPGEHRQYDVGNTPFFIVFEETIVPERSVLVLGDNLGDSIDSRVFGFVSTERVLGRVVF